MSDGAVERLDVIAIGPHPDDLEITCGGTLARLVKQGYKVGMIDLTTGEPTPRGSEETRAREAEAARKILGVQVRVNLGLPNRELMDGPPARYALATELRRYRPSIIYPFDAEQRHWHSTFVIDITETFEQKLEAVRCYESQFDGDRANRLRHFLSGYNIFAGGRCGFAYGESFALPTPIGASDLVALVHGGKGSPVPVQLPGTPPKEKS
jgi:LmbE family N-acetylglucosaminyl deacetylase